MKAICFNAEVAENAKEILKVGKNQSFECVIHPNFLELNLILNLKFFLSFLSVPSRTLRLDSLKG